MTEPIVKTTPKDFFLHFLSIVSLYIAAVSFGVLLFQYIDRFFPDPLTDVYYAAQSSASAMRWALASLVIVFPVYIWISWYLARDIERHTEKRELRIRKWLLYFTLFVAAVVIIGDLVALIYNFLGGDLSARFILKVCAILFIAGIVFGYYLWNLRTERRAVQDPRMRIFVFAITAFVVVSIIAGFFFVGSPFAERMRRFDDRRVSDLQTIQWQIINYWQTKEKLPASLDDLRDEISGFIPPKDPETGNAYEYRVLGKTQFELCGMFSAVSRVGAVENMPRAVAVSDGGALEIWAHDAGRACFTRTIDPERYPFLPKGK